NNMKILIFQYFQYLAIGSKEIVFVLPDNVGFYTDFSKFLAKGAFV
ncbi:unnamed protein product, partial [marine sediment metagenome]